MRMTLRSAVAGWALASALSFAAPDKLQDAVAALASQDESSYEQAQSYLMKHGQQAEPALRALFHDASQPPLARLRAIKLLGDLGDCTAIDDLKQALGSGNESNAAIRVEMIRSLSKLGAGNALVDYLKSGHEESPAAIAAIAIALQGSSDDESKKALGSLLMNDNARVVKAAMFAVQRTYQPPEGPAKPAAQHPCNQPKFMASSAAPGGKIDPTPGDQAIFQALHSKQASSDPQISQQAASVLATVTQQYKQP